MVWPIVNQMGAKVNSFLSLWLACAHNVFQQPVRLRLPGEEACRVGGMVRIHLCMRLTPDTANDLAIVDDHLRRNQPSSLAAVPAGGERLSKRRRPNIIVNRGLNEVKKAFRF